MAGVEDHTEYEGGGLMPNTVFPKGTDALTASDKLRLMSITGQELDSRAPVDPYFWTGGVGPDEEAIAVDQRARRTRARALRQSEVDRYRESQY